MIIRKSNKKLSADDYTPVGKIPPQATDLEEVVLGAILLEKSAYGKISKVLKPESFYKPEYQVIFTACQTLFQRNDPIDIMTVSAQLRKSGELDKAGGQIAILELTNRVASSANIEAHAAIIADAYKKRKLIEIGGEMQQKGFDETTNTIDIYTEATKQLIDLGANTSKKESLMPDILKSVYVMMDEALKTPNGIIGIPYGLRDVDDRTGGKQKGTLTIIAARPSMGKTAFMLNASKHVTVFQKKRAAIFSYETKSESVAFRLLSEIGDLPLRELKKGKYVGDERLDRAMAILAESGYIVDEDKTSNIFQIKAKLYEFKAKYDIQEAYFDYLQIIPPADERILREQQIAQISRNLKSISIDLDIPIIALCQVSRSVEDRTDKLPRLTDLRESGAIEQDADVVMFLHRPHYYGLKDANGYPYSPSQAEIILAKNKEDATGTIPILWDGEIGRFYDIPPQQQGFSFSEDHF